MKKKKTQLEEYYNKAKRDFIKEDLLESYKSILRGDDIKIIIRLHKKTIDKMLLKGKNKNKYKTLVLLEHYRNTKNKTLALIHLTNTLNNKSLFRSFLTD